MDFGAWWATVHAVPEELDMTWQLNNIITVLFPKEQQKNSKNKFQGEIFH